jgi:hypothetical protein
LLASVRPADNEGEGVSKTVHKTAFLRLTSLGNNWHSESLLVRFRATPRKVGKVKITQAGVEELHFTEKSDRSLKSGVYGL